MRCDAWWPGGRTSAYASWLLPSSTASAAFSAVPAAARIASQEPGPTSVVRVKVWPRAHAASTSAM